MGNGTRFGTKRIPVKRPVVCVRRGGGRHADSSVADGQLGTIERRRIIEYDTDGVCARFHPRRTRVSKERTRIFSRAIRSQSILVRTVATRRFVDRLGDRSIYHMDHRRTRRGDLGDRDTGWFFVIAMLVVAIGNRFSAFLDRKVSPRYAAHYIMLSASGVIIGAAGLLRNLGVEKWHDQAPLLMVIPILYLLASVLRTERSVRGPLQWAAHGATAVIVILTVLASTQLGQPFRLFWNSGPSSTGNINLLAGLVFAQALLFYSLAAVIRRKQMNVYLAAMAGCASVWQFILYFVLPDSYYTLIFASLMSRTRTQSKGFHDDDQAGTSTDTPRQTLASDLSASGQTTGENGKQLLQLGGKFEINIEQQVYLRGDLFQLKLPIDMAGNTANASITMMAESRNRLKWREATGTGNLLDPHEPPHEANNYGGTPVGGGHTIEPGADVVDWF